MLTQLGQLAVDERPRRRRDDDLAAVPAGGDPRRAVQLVAGVALAGQTRLTGVQADPHVDRPGGERLLTLGRCGERLDGIGECVQEGVSLRIDLDAAVSGEGAAQETAVLGERLT